MSISSITATTILNTIGESTLVTTRPLFRHADVICDQRRLYLPLHPSTQRLIQFVILFILVVVPRGADARTPTRLLRHRTRQIKVTVIGTDVRLAWLRAHGIKRYRVTLDDASGFLTPTVVRDVMGTTVRFAWDEQAIVPGTTYYVRVEPKGLSDNN